MATPLGHALAGLALGPLVAWRRPFLGPRADLALFAALSQAPDLDFLPGLLIGRPEAFHHAQSHSLGAALAVGLLAALYGRVRGDAWRWGVLGFVLVLGHALLDAIGQDTSYPYGVPLWWPLSDHYLLADWAPFLDIRRKPLGWGIVWHNLRAMGLEVLLLGPPAALVLWFVNRARAAHAR